MCFGLTGPISGERSHLQAPRGAYFEHLSNTSSFQVLDCSNTSSCQSNSHPYPGNPCLTLDVPPWSTLDRPLGSPSRLLLHPLAMRLILGIDPDSHLQGGWQSASERLKNGPSGRRHTPRGHAWKRALAGKPRRPRPGFGSAGGLDGSLPWRGQERQLERRGAMLKATCRLVVRQRSVAMDPWILHPQTAGDQHKTFSKVRPFRSCAPGRPNFEEFRPEVGPTQHR